MNWIPANDSDYKWNSKNDADVRRTILFRYSPADWDHAKKYLFAINYLNQIASKIKVNKDFIKLKSDKEYFYKQLRSLKEVGI